MRRMKVYIVSKGEMHSGATIDKVFRYHDDALAYIAKEYPLFTQTSGNVWVYCEDYIEIEEYMVIYSLNTTE